LDGLLNETGDARGLLIRYALPDLAELMVRQRDRDFGGDHTIHRTTLVGQTIAFRGLPPSAAWQTTQTDRLPHRG
jgi:hypothetical protein